MPRPRVSSGRLPPDLRHDHLSACQDLIASAFATAEGWSQDVSADVTQELRHRCDLQFRDVPFFLQDFVDRYEGRYRDVQLPLPMRLAAAGCSQPITRTTRSP